MPSDFSVVVEKGVVLFFCVIFAGMKHLLWIIVAMMVLGAVVPGCDDVPRYDGRLTAADSLIHDHADSALTMLEALAPSDLATEGDRAYHDLLLTQARYRVCITATSDSDINRALDYYKRHPKDREKLTRAYIYKGAVMEELGHPDSAMLYYKQAESVASPDDYFNLGYINMRMGALYSDNFALDGQPIEKYETALSFFIKADNLEYQYICLNNLGCQYRDSDPNKAEKLLRSAAEISGKRNDTINHLEDLHSLALLYYYCEKYDSALCFVQDALNYDASNISFSFCTTAANVYARNGLIDSAKIFLDCSAHFIDQNDEKEKMYLLESESEIALAEGDTMQYLKSVQQESTISNSLITNDRIPIILKTEQLVDRERREKTNRRLSIATILVIISIIVGITLLAFFLVNIFKSRRYRQIIDELKKESQEQLLLLDDLQNHFDTLKIKESRIREFVATQVKMLREITTNCYREPKNKLGTQIKNIIAYQNENKHLWPLIYGYIDAEYNNIISNTRKRFPDLNDRELLLLALCCMDFSYIQMAIILGYSNSTSVGTMKTRLSEKMGCSLNEYISAYK